MATTVVSANITIEGELSTDEELVILGTIRGKVSTRDNLVVERSGVIEADVASGAAQIAGSVTGDISSSDRVDLQNGAKVVGNVRATRITIADGAQFKGNVDMDG